MSKALLPISSTRKQGAFAARTAAIDSIELLRPLEFEPKIAKLVARQKQQEAEAERGHLTGGREERRRRGLRERERHIQRRKPDLAAGPGAAATCSIRRSNGWNRSATAR